MELNIPKNRIATLIIFAIFSIFITLALGLYQMNRMAQNSYKEKLSAYDSTTDTITSILKQEIKDNYYSLQTSANLLAKSGELNEVSIAQTLNILSQNKFYQDLAIVDKDGIGYNLSGEKINVASNSYYQTAMKGIKNASDHITFTKQNVPVITYAVPIQDKNDIKGVLIAEIGAKLKKLEQIQNAVKDGSIIYIINNKNELICFTNDIDVKDFNYNELINKGYLRSGMKSTIPTISLKDFYKSNESAKYIWDKKLLEINNWYALVGKQDFKSPITHEVMRITNTIWIFIAVILISLFTVMIYVQRKSNRKVIQMLYLDPVTGGDNWYKFRSIVNKILAGKQFDKKKYALVNFDINRFKIINDIYGYQKGDEVLKEIYNIIDNWVQPGEYFARYAADQFYILLTYNNEYEINRRIHELDNYLHQLHYIRTARILFGVYYITETVHSIDRMAEFASIAKNNNKCNAESILSYFDDAARAKLLEEEEIENSMKDALENNEFHVFLQPKYNTKEQQIAGAEALVRWYNSKGDFICPSYFIPLFEKNGFIMELDYYMIRSVCKLIREWLDKGFLPTPISVNISRVHFANPHSAEMIRTIVDDYNVPHNLVELEITESAFLQNKQMLIETVLRLREYGFLVSMDDFGAGYSSLNSLKDLPLDVVKLDGELFRLTREVERGLTVIRNTINMAKDLHMKVVAECIETKEQVEYLCTVGCDMIQGYYFAKPMPVDQFESRYLMVGSID